MKFPAILAVSAALALGASAQKMQTPAGEAPGPWLLGTIGVGKGADGKSPQETALKGLAIRLGANGEAAVAYDLDLCRMVGAWSGKFTTPMNLMSRGEYPSALGEVAFTTGAVPGFAIGDAKAPWKDPRPEPFGLLPLGQARFKGFYVNGDKTILKWDLAGTEVLEMPETLASEGLQIFIRHFASSGPIADPLTLNLFRQDHDAVAFQSQTFGLENPSADGLTDLFQVISDAKQASAAGFIGLPGDPMLRYDGPEWSIKISSQPKAFEFVAIMWRGKPEHAARAKEVLRRGIPRRNLRALISGGPARWPEPVVTQGELAKDNSAAYVVDTIKLPDPNPWGAPMFTSGFDFFERPLEGTAPSVPGGDDGSPPAAGRGTDGAVPSRPAWDAAVCTFHGDVFLVSGIDEKLEKVRWRRFASGLYHPLGLRIVKGEIFVACRDGLWRLNDINKDGECDYYELFNGDLKVTKNFHEFVFDLQTDAAGNFYFAKAGPVKNGGRGFDQIMSQHGTLMRVSPDGARLDVVATGFRAPNGIGVSPRGELTSGDNEGTWTPACKINWIKPGGFYGVVDLAHRTPPPTDYDRPLCWLPKRVDNSGGSQVWVPPGERWGPWGGKMLHLSYGQSALYGVLAEECGMWNAERGMKETAPAAANSALRAPHSALVQGGVVKFPLQFQSGIMRARFNPRDGQLYVMGLRGWQTNGLKNGCFQRVRYTGAVPRMPIEMHAKKGGIELRFACSLDTQTAADPQNWNIEQWRYVWSAAYGSPELSTEDADAAPGEVGKDGRAEFSKAQAEQKKHDPVPVKSVSIGTDDRTVFLEIPGLKPVMQMAIRYDLKTAEGEELRGEVVNTIHALGE